jgi:hypothetical protein
MHINIEQLERTIADKSHEVYMLKRWLKELKDAREKKCEHNYVLYIYNCDTDDKKCYRCTKCERIY